MSPNFSFGITFRLSARKTRRAGSSPHCYPEQFLSLIQDENGLAVACDGDRIIAYAMAASGNTGPDGLFRHMIADLPNIEYLGRILSTENSYQYGPVCAGE